jgi:uncharacterized protein
LSPVADLALTCQEKSMNCPRCEAPSMIELDRHGVTIDRCERCRGIWLDRGELEKLIALDVQPATPRVAQPRPVVAARVAREDSDDHLPAYSEDRRTPYRRDDDHDDDDRRHSGKRRSIWDIFD